MIFQNRRPVSTLFRIGSGLSAWICPVTFALLLSSCVEPTQQAVPASATATAGANPSASPTVVNIPSGEVVRFGFDTRILKVGNRIDDVLLETLSGSGNFKSKFTLTNSQSLDAGMKWIGEPFKEIGDSGSGVFRSADGMRQFRIDKNSLAGAHAPGVVHVHYETYLPGDNHISANNHVPIDER
jgi:hypothetical protein